MSNRHDTSRTIMLLTSYLVPMNGWHWNEMVKEMNDKVNVVESLFISPLWQQCQPIGLFISFHGLNGNSEMRKEERKVEREAKSESSIQKLVEKVDWLN